MSEWWAERPATTVAADSRVFPPGHFHRRDGDPENDSGAGENGPPIMVELCEALALQTFPLDTPVLGPRPARYTQVGNAMPPLLAKAILAELLR